MRKELSYLNKQVKEDKMLMKGVFWFAVIVYLLTMGITNLLDFVWSLVV